MATRPIVFFPMLGAVFGAAWFTRNAGQAKPSAQMVRAEEEKDKAAASERASGAENESATDDATPPPKEGEKPVKDTPHAGMKDRVNSTPEQKQAGADATKPSEIPVQGWKNVLRRTAAGFLQDRVMTEAAGVTFYVLLALFPAIASFISIYGLITSTASLIQQMSQLHGIVPAGGLGIITDQVKAITSKPQTALGFAAILGLLISLWSANSGMKSLFDALNVVYHEHEKRGFIRLTLISFCFTLGTIFFITIALLVVVAVPIVLNFVGLGNETAILLAIARWPVMFLIITLALAFIYRFGPSRNRAKWQWVSWGSASAAVLWIVASLVFSFYVGNFGNYNKTYGSLGAVVGFMTWIWISSMVVLMGAELNAELEQQTDRDSTVGPEKPKGARGAFKADVKA